MPEEEPQNIIDQLFQLLQQLLLPDWSDLIRLLPWVLIAAVLGWLVFTAIQWRRAAAPNRSRVPARLRGGAPPPGVHMPGPSRWPFVVPIGAAILLFSFVLVPRDAQNNPTQPVNGPLFVIGMIVTIVAVLGWLRDAMREWRETEHGIHEPALAVAGGHAAALMPGAAGGALVPSRGSAMIAVAAEPEFVAVEPPPGVHMPGPSPWPFFLPIAATVMLFGVIFSSILIVGGLILAVIGLGGWLRDAWKEWQSTEEVGHAVPETRDPVKAWPKRLVPIFASVIAISVLITLAPVGLTYLNSLTPASAGPTAAAVPEVPEISASTAVSFETSTLVVPAGRPFDLIFHNKQEGVPHNVKLTESSAATNVLFDGEIVTGPTDITYNVPAIDEGDYYFLCQVHPNMNGTLQVRPETGGPGGAPAGPGASPGAAPSP
jgi:plastocyanin